MPCGWIRWHRVREPSQGALEWANRLGWDLYGVLSSWWVPSQPTADPTLCACTAACAGQGVTWEVTAEADLKTQTAELCVIGDGLDPSGKNLVVRQVLGVERTPMLMCPQSRQPLSRMLVLNQHRGGIFLEEVVRCAAC